MHGMEVNLPGGLANNGNLQRHVKFHPLTGRIEQALLEFDKGLERPEYVTTVLSSVLDRIGEQQADERAVAGLCVADRQYLMIRLAAMLNGENMWLKVNCGYCKEAFDIQVQRCDLPVKEAGSGFPNASITLENDVLQLRVPNGLDQHEISNLSDEEAMLALLGRCISQVNGRAPPKLYIENLSESQINLIDEALDDIAPAVCEQLLVSCPECNKEQHAVLDHYTIGNTNKYLFYDEVHTIASHYHWSEASILAMPREKRRLYIDIINRYEGKAEHGWDR